jgi:hypothetical protein
MPRWIFHTGYSKTGTTALQDFLATRRRLLRDQGILYPDMKYAGLRLGLENHNAIAATLAGMRPPLGIPAEGCFDQFRAQAAAQPGCDLVVLSAEGFTGHPNVLLYDTETAFRAAEDAYIARLRALAGDDDVTIMVYLRRQDHWLNSTANQRIKFEGRNAGPAFDTIERFYDLQKPRLDYLTSLDRWAAHFGAGNMIVRPYETAQLAGGSVVSDFFSAINRPDIATLAPAPDRDRAVNPGLSRDVLEFKKRLNPAIRSTSEAEALGDLLSGISAEMGGRSEPLLPPALRRAIVEEYAPANSEIARKYMGRANGGLFHEPWPDADAPWTPYPGLSPQIEAEIAARLRARRRSLSGRAFMARKHTGKILRDRLPQMHLLARSLYQTLLRH